MVRKVAIVGVGSTHVTSYKDTLDHELLIKALKMALDDANISKEDIEGLSFAFPRLYCKQDYFSTFIAGYLRIPSFFIAESLGDGLTGALVFQRAVAEVAQGNIDVCLALGVSRETHVKTSEHYLITSIRSIGDVDFQSPFGFAPICWYAFDANRYMYEHRATSEDLAAVAVKNRKNSTKNPIAYFREGPLITTEDVINSRMISDPLHLLDCCPRADAAVALVIVPEERAREFPKAPVVLRASGFFHEGVHMISDKPSDILTFEAARRATEIALERGNLTIQDIDFAEIYAPFTIVEILAAEAAGFFPRGKGAKAIAAGEADIGGRIPINTSGGALSRGHAPRVTGLLSIFEIVRQLREEAGERGVPNAKIGLSVCELGNYNAAQVDIFERR